MRVLRWAAATPARYVAMIGSKRKVIAVVKELEKEGLSREQLARIYAPMGLEIGAISPEEIAISVAAEMIAVRRNHFRRHRDGDFFGRDGADLQPHGRIDPGQLLAGESFFFQFLDH